MPKAQNFYDFLEEQRTINSQYHGEMLENKVKPAILKMRRGLLFFQDNARPHTAQSMLETTEKLGSEVLPHPPYRPDHAPSDFFLFGALKKLLRSGKLNNDTEMKTNVEN